MKTFTTPEIVSLNIEKTANGWFCFHTEGKYNCKLWNITAGNPAPSNPDPIEEGDGKGDEKGDTTSDDISGEN